MPRLLILNVPRSVGPEDGYAVRGWTRRYWPRDGSNLGAAGAWNVFFRLGFVPTVVSSEEPPAVERDDVLLVASSAETMPSWTRGWLDGAGTQGTSVVWSGNPRSFAAEMGLRLEAVSGTGHALHALAWLRPEPVPVAPPGAALATFSGGVNVGSTTAIGGERQTPTRAVLYPLDAPAAVRHGRHLFLNGDPFGGFQAWLQGQSDVRPWLAWRDRFYWLDEMAGDLFDFLQRAGVRLDHLPRPGVAGLRRTTIVLRHDLDSSRDTSYLQAEVDAGMPGVHAVLLDRNARFWVRAVAARAPSHEIGFHYNTIHQPIWRRIATKLGQPEPAYRPAVDEIVGRGLVRQIARARRQGVSADTVHRHGPFVLYPESLLALDEAYRGDHPPLGSSSLSYGAILRWGTDRADGVRGGWCDPQDTPAPLAFPFRLCDASRGGRLLDGWEITCLQEPEPAAVAQLIGRDMHHTLQRLLVLNFHPAHAHGPTLVKGGSLPSFRQTLELLREQAVDVRTLADVFRAATSACGRPEAGIADAVA